MPRGNTKDNIKKSPVIGDAGILATPAELTALTQNIKENFLKDISRPPVDLHNEKQVTEAIYNYFVECERAGKRPGNMGLYRALDINRCDMHNILSGKSKNKVNPACLNIIKKALQLLSEYREQLNAQGKLNPVSYIFWAKNFDGLEDTNRLEVAAAAGPEAMRSPEDIQKQIEKDIPIDTTYKE